MHQHLAACIVDFERERDFQVLVWAPGNWTVPGINQVRRYGKVGPVLLRFAVEQSVAEGCGGRLGLHALDQAEGFYTGIGMTPLGPDEDKDDLAYFEFTEQAALLFLRR